MFKSFLEEKKMITELGRFLRILRIKTGDSLRTMSEKLGISASYLSSIENGKRNIPVGFEKEIIRSYVMNDDDKNKLMDAMYKSMDQYNVDLSSMDEKKKQVLFSITEGDLDENTINKLCEVISNKEPEK